MPTDTDYVDVTNEPRHPQVFQSETLRAYICAIPPGATTLYHRHGRDTVYIVLQGGVLRTRNMNGYRRSPTAFPRSFPIPRRVWLGIQTVLAGASTLRPRTFFITLSGKRETIHAVSASDRNPNDVRLMGVEILRDSGAPATLPSFYRREYRRNNATVYRLVLGSAEATAEHRLSGPAFFVCLGGTAEIRLSSEPAGSPHRHTLRPEGFLWTEQAATLSIVNTGSETLEMVVVVP